MKPLKNILTADILITDKIAIKKGKDEASAPDWAKPIHALVGRYQQRPEPGLKAGGKMSITSLQRTQDFEPALQLAKDAGKMKDCLGGSAANTCHNVGLFSPDINVTFMGVTGEPTGALDDPDTLIRRDLEQARIKLVCPEAPLGVTPESATSFVIKTLAEEGQDADRTIATCPGTAKQILKAKHLTPGIVQDQDAVFVYGSLWGKLEETHSEEIPTPVDRLGFADKMLHLRWENHKELFFAMPTQADFSNKAIKLTHEQRAKHFRTLIESSNVMLGNGEELSRVYTNEEEYREIQATLAKYDLVGKNLAKHPELLNAIPDETRSVADPKKTLKAKYDFVNQSIQDEEALTRLERVLAGHALETHAAAAGWTDEEVREKTHQVAFITLGKKGAAVITADGGIKKVAAAPFFEVDIKNTLGAGDSAFAGFLNGYLAKRNLGLDDATLNFEDCARLGMWMAREKLLVDAARIPDPREAIKSRLAATALGTDPYLATAENPTDEIIFAERMQDALFKERDRGNLRAGRPSPLLLAPSVMLGKARPCRDMFPG